MGEYARCLVIATALARRRPDLEIHFALSRAAPYAAAAPFPATLLPSSPTFNTREVCALIRDFRPTVAFFDNAGRTRQLRAAHQAGARVIFVSSRRRQRRKAFRLRSMALIDEHWIAWPEFIAGALTLMERMKLRLRRRPRIRFVDTLLPAADPKLAAECLARFGLRAGEYVLAVPGGGTGHPGAEDAPAIVARAAHAIAQRGHATFLVGSAPGGGDCDRPQLQHTALLSPSELCELIRRSRLVVCNGGDTLLQVLACGRACIAVPVAGDQPHRIASCVRLGIALAAKLDARSIEQETVALLENEALRSALEQRLAPRPVHDCMNEVLEALESCLGDVASGQPEAPMRSGRQSATAGV